MKLLIIAASVMALIGCAAESKPVEDKVPQPKAQMVYGIDLSTKSDTFPDFNTEFEWQNTLANEYGLNGYKAIHYCYEKYLPEMDVIDPSTDSGAARKVQIEKKIENCAVESLKDFDKIPEAERQNIPANEEPNFGLELTDEEVISYNDELSPYERFKLMEHRLDEALEKSGNELPGFYTPYDHTNKRYNQLSATCSENNQSIEDNLEFVESVHFCVSESM